MTRTPTQRLDDIEAAINRINVALALLSRKHQDPEADIVFDATLYRLLVIGEAVKALPDDVRDAAPEVPWRNVMRLRDVLSHHYHRVDLAIVRVTCEVPLAQLAAAMPRLRVAAVASQE